MGRLLLSQGDIATTRFALQLEEDLPDDYLVVCDPVIWGEALDAVVVAPQGLFVLYVKAWQGLIRPRLRGAWREERADGKVIKHQNPAKAMRRAEKALESFLKDEAPDWTLRIRHYLVLEEPEAEVSVYGATEPPVVRLEELPERIIDAPPLGEGELEDVENREALALALRDIRLTATQRTSQPFVFRTSGFLGLGRKVRTVRRAVKYMDRHPQQGIEHLQNGTLASWLSDEGAPHLADLARDVTSGTVGSGRIALEKFVYGTGLVRRPRVRVRPRRIDIGYVLSGEMGSARLRVRKGLGRGYLYGQLLADAPWLRVEPSRLDGSLDALVTADTDPLVITEQPSDAGLELESNASEEPIEIPVRVYAVPEPSKVVRWLLRPLVGLIVGAVLGGVFGWAFWQWGLGGALWPDRFSALPSSLGWMAVVGLVGAILGLARGLTQRLEWPIFHALGRWLLRVVLSSLALAAIAAGLMGFATWLYPGWGLDMVSATSLSILLGAGLIGFIGATASEISKGRQREIIVGSGWSARARLWTRRGAVAVVLALVLLVGGRIAPPVAARYDVDARAATAKEWAGERFSRLEERLNGWVDGIRLRYYEEQAPGKSGGSILDIFKK
ncbi:MAG: nuclease-related domain-containing protein [Chloroflexota bacterium]|nr:nuclease-related domain-containing protein [Chloroflexota bacterium]